MANQKAAFVEDFERLYKEHDAALVQAEEERRQKTEHADRAREQAAEAGRLREDLATEKAAHADARAKVGTLQSRVGIIPELERKYAEAVSDVDRLRSETSQQRLTIAKLEQDLEQVTGARSEAEAKLKIAEDKLASFDKLVKGLTALSVAKEIVAAEVSVLG